MREVPDSHQAHEPHRQAESLDGLSSQPPEESHGAESADGPNFADLDRLYQQALEAMQAVESGLKRASDTLTGKAASAATLTEGEGLGKSSSLESDPAGIPKVSISGFPGSDTPQVESLRAGEPLESPAPASGDTIVCLTPGQIIEAALFVGGTALTTKKLCSMLRGDFDPDFVDGAIDELNQQYTRQSRPYEIRFGEGGYRLVLRREFQRVRNRVFGFGPKEVKLSQETLEILALVAYKQPISRREIENVGKNNAGGVLRQLLRRELIAIERGEDRRTDVKYRTTGRFLQLFGLGRLDELPQAEELSLK